MFGLEKLGLLHFDARKCYVHSAKFLRCQIVPFNPWFQIVRGVELSVYTHSVKLSAESNCPWCQIVRCQIVRIVKFVLSVKLSCCQIVLESPSKYCSFLVFLSLERKQLKI